MSNVRLERKTHERRLGGGRQGGLTGQKGLKWNQIEYLQGIE